MSLMVLQSINRCDNSVDGKKRGCFVKPSRHVRFSYVAAQICRISTHLLRSIKLRIQPCALNALPFRDSPRSSEASSRRARTFTYSCQDDPSERSAQLVAVESDEGSPAAAGSFDLMGSRNSRRLVSWTKSKAE